MHDKIAHPFSFPSEYAVQCVVYWTLTGSPPFSGTSHNMEKGRISLTPYYVVEQLLLRGEAELV